MRVRRAWRPRGAGRWRSAARVDRRGRSRGRRLRSRRCPGRAGCRVRRRPGRAGHRSGNGEPNQPGRGAVVDGAEARGGEGGEDPGVRGDALRDVLAATQAAGDQVESVAAVHLGTRFAAGRAAIVAAHQEVTGREAGGVESVEDVADLAGAGVHVVLGAVAVEADRVGAAAEAGELPQQFGHGAERGQFGEFGQRGWCGAGDDGVLLLASARRGRAPGAADAWRYRGRPGVCCSAGFSGGAGRGASSAGPRRRWPRRWP